MGESDELFAVAEETQVAVNREARIAAGAVWTGKNGWGPTVRVDGIDLDTGEVHYTYVPADRTHPTGKTDIRTFVQNYRPQ